MLETSVFEQNFMNWTQELRVETKDIVSFDGKTMRRTKGNFKACHIVSAWSSENQIVLDH